MKIIIKPYLQNKVQEISAKSVQTEKLQVGFKKPYMVPPGLFTE